MKAAFLPLLERRILLTPYPYAPRGGYSLPARGGYSLPARGGYSLLRRRVLLTRKADTPWRTFLTRRLFYRNVLRCVTNVSVGAAGNQTARTAALTSPAVTPSARSARPPRSAARAPSAPSATSTRCLLPLPPMQPATRPPSRAALASPTSTASARSARSPTRAALVSTPPSTSPLEFGPNHPDVRHHLLLLTMITVNLTPGNTGYYSRPEVLILNCKDPNHLAVIWGCALVPLGSPALKGK